jgi:hypothetical protein
MTYMKKLIPAGLFVLLSLCALPATAQVVAPPDTLTLINEPIPSEAPVPRSAFIRALIVPGWGHLSMGETRRAAVFIGLQGTSWFMLGKTIMRYNDAHDIELGLEALAIDSVEAEMAQDTALARELTENAAAYAQAVSSYPGLGGARDLARSRRRHREDWIVYTLFFTFAAAVDAYVTAHLAGFPADVTVSGSRDDGLSLGVRVPVGRVK